MRRVRIFFGLMTLAVGLVAGLTATAMAQDAEVPDKAIPAFQCSAQTEGQLTCQAGRQCECVFKGADKGRGLPARWAWDCSILRAKCDVVPADTADDVTMPAVIVEQDRDGRKRKKKEGEEN